MLPAISEVSLRLLGQLWIGTGRAQQLCPPRRLLSNLLNDALVAREPLTVPVRYH